MAYSIYLNKNENWDLIATIGENKISASFDVGIPKTVLNSTWNLIYQIKKLNDVDTPQDHMLDYKVYINDDLMSVIFKVIAYRRSCVYLVLQWSTETKKLRVLIYGTDKINHYGQCFGTSLPGVRMYDIRKYIDDYIEDEEYKNLRIPDEAKRKLSEKDFVLFCT